MEHFYEKIDGFFDYDDLFTLVVNKLPNEAHIVEIGAYKGRSSAYLAVECINANKNIKLDIIDSWNGEDGTNRPPWSDYTNCSGDIFEQFKSNLKPVWNFINPIQSLSAPAADLYQDKSLDFVFIDANHHYDGVKEDILKWLPKIKDGGIMAGHDYNMHSWPGVVKAIHESFETDKIKVIKSSWMVQL